MDINKKIEIINNLKNVLHQDIFEEVVEAMQKQIPKYCKWCGQKVKWV